jgi:hypothetical protein
VAVVAATGGAAAGRGSVARLLATESWSVPRTTAHAIIRLRFVFMFVPFVLSEPVRRGPRRE